MIKLSIEEIDNENNYGSNTLEKEPEVKEPPLYQVILLNDDYTPMEFVDCSCV
jgi:ATP-dependent Clp protease adaptor protein ClpS